MKIDNNSSSVELVESDEPWYLNEHFTSCNKKSMLRKKRLSTNCKCNSKKKKYNFTTLIFNFILMVFSVLFLIIILKKRKIFKYR
jgi:hypothetical protein